MNISKENSYLLKGIAIITVILSHANNFGLICKEIDTYIPIMLCEIGMGIFLFLSGFGLYKSFRTKGFDGFWEGKLRSIILPYIIVQALFMIKDTVIGNLEMSWTEKVGHLMGIVPDNVVDPTMWYISYILFLYVLFWSIFSLFNERTALILLSFSGVVLFYLVPHIWVNAIYYSFAFPLGVLFSYLDIKKIELMNRGYMLIHAVISVVTIILWYMLFWRSQLLESIFVIVCVYLMVYWVGLIRFETVKKILIITGEVSFFVFLIEYRITMKMIAFFERVPLVHDFVFWQYISFALSVAISVGVCLIADKLWRICLKFLDRTKVNPSAE